MKTLKLIFTLSLIAFSIKAQTVTSSCNLNDVNGYLYKDDADRLAIRYSYRFNSTWKDSTWIDQQLSNKYLKALLAVHNATDIPARDTVVTWLNIHTIAQRPELREFFIAADSNLVWLKNLRYNILPCGQPHIDAAITKYGFQKTRFDAVPFLPWHTVYWDASYNFNGNPLASAIGSSVSGISMIGGDNGFSDGIDIRDSLNPNFIDLLYCYRWGDCIDGCDYARYWRFRVYNDCNVEYAGTFGNQLPIWASITNSSNIDNSVKIYPVPVQDKFSIESNSNTIVSIVVYNHLGQETIKATVDDLKTELDISNLDSGIYLIQIQTSKGQKLTKILKN